MNIVQVILKAVSLKKRKSTIIMTNSFHKFLLLLFFDICALL